MHQFDTMHGVHVAEGARHSLVVWFADSPEAIADGTAPWVERAAQTGNPEAMFILGGFYYRGEFGHATDARMAVRWLSAAAAAGNPLASLHVGSMLSCGEVRRLLAPYSRQSLVTFVLVSARCSVPPLASPPPSQPLLPASRFLLPTSYLLPPTPYILLISAFFLLPTSYFLPPTSYLLLPPTSYLLPPTPTRSPARLP